MGMMVVHDASKNNLMLPSHDMYCGNFTWKLIPPSIAVNGISYMFISLAIELSSIWAKKIKCFLKFNIICEFGCELNLHAWARVIGNSIWIMSQFELSVPYTMMLSIFPNWSRFPCWKTVEPVRHFPCNNPRNFPTIWRAWWFTIIRSSELDCKSAVEWGQRLVQGAHPVPEIRQWM